MTRDKVLQQLKDAEPSLRARGVAHAALFGSLARGEEGPDSDIDIVVEFDPAMSVGVWGYVGVVQLIQGLFAKRVDVIDRDGLKPSMKPGVTADALYAF